VPDGTATTTRVSARARVSGAAALRALGVDLDRPLVTAAWRASRLRGAIVLSGRASNARALAIRLRAPGLTARPAGTLRTGDGRFRRRVPLPVGVLPGTLALELGDGPRALARIRVRIPAPPEGVARSAVAAVARAGAAVTSAPAATRILFARFSLASLPAGGRPLTITWYQPSGQVAGHPVLKPRRRALVSFVRSRAALPAGRWRAVLSAGDVRVAQVSVRLGSA
jgi:hypothetical protein